MSAGVNLSVAIMHHPSRADLLPSLLGPLTRFPVEVVTDPDPHSFPSPLRTAKVAWSAVHPDATHHLVLQDDVVLVPDFADHIQRAIEASPDNAIALYVMANSPLNAHLTRLAALIGSPWAALSYREWVPAQGLVVPVEHAHGLAAYLRQFPDKVRDDDELIIDYCASRDVGVLVTVPNLVDHADVPSLSGHGDHGPRRAVIVSDANPLQIDFSNRAPLETGLLNRSLACDRRSFSLDFSNGLCNIRLAPGGLEAIGTEFSWRWLDAARVIGVDERHVVDALLADLARLPERVLAVLREPATTHLAVEVYAACFLLSWDARDYRAHIGTADTSGVPAMIVSSWLEAATPAEPAPPLPNEVRSALESLGAAGLATGGTYGDVSPDTGRHTAPREEILTTLRNLAHRDALALTLVPREIHAEDRAGLPLLDLVVVPCPWCADAGAGDLPTVSPFPDVPAIPSAQWRPSGRPSLHLLSCERPSVRSFVPLAKALDDPRLQTRHFQTRAAAYVHWGLPLRPTAGEFGDALDVLDAHERCWSDGGVSAPGSGRVVLPTTMHTSPSFSGSVDVGPLERLRLDYALCPITEHLPWHLLGDGSAFYLRERANALIQRVDAQTGSQPLRQFADRFSVSTR